MANSAGEGVAAAEPVRFPVSGYIATTCIVSVLAAVVLSRSTLSDLGEAIVYWLLYALTCGILINQRVGTRPGNLFLYSLPSPTVLIAVFLFELIFNGATLISGKQLQVSQLPDVWWLFVIIWILSVVAIWVFSFARDVVLFALKSVFSLSTANAGRIEATLNWLVRIVGVAGLLARAFVK